MPQLPDVGTAWNGVDLVLYDIVNRFKVPQNCALEFGVQFGYSTAALANIFRQVVGVDTFVGDVHSGYVPNHFQETAKRLLSWPNIVLVQANFRDYCKYSTEQFDLIHVDIVHNYEETYDCGMWAVQHSPVVLFHDTEAFPRVMEAVSDVAQDSNRKFYNFGACAISKHGLGILVNE